MLAATALHRPALGIPAAIGAFITGFTSLQGIYRTRLAAVLFAAAGMSITSFIGALAAHWTPGIVAATVVAGYAVGALGQISAVASTVALNSFVAFILFSSQPLPVSAAAQDSALVLAGGLIQAALVLIAWPLSRRAAERTALAEVYRNLAAYARTLAGGSAGMPPIVSLAMARQILADPQPFSPAGEIARLRRLLEDSEIVRRRLGAAAATKANPAEFSAVAQSLDDVARGLMDEQPSSFGLLSKARPGPPVRNRIVWLGRDSFRFAAVVGIAMVIGRHFQSDRGYWIPLTAAIVLKPDFQTTFVRGAGRIAGTLAGAVVATFAAAPLRGHVFLENAGVLVTAAAAYVTFNPNYAIFTVAITSFVVIVLGMRGLPGTTTIEMRLIDTLVGGGLAMAGYLALPSWEHKRTRALLADLLEAQRRFASLMLRQDAAPSNELRGEIEKARNNLWHVRTTVESSIDRTRREPHRPHSIGAGRALRLLAATQRFGLANLAFEAVETQDRAAIPELPQFAAALDGQMAELAAALRESRRAQFDKRLATMTAQFQQELAQTRDPARRFALERMIAYGDAAARIARLAGHKRV